MKWISVVIVTIITLVISFQFKSDLPATEVDAKYSNAESEFLNMENGARVHYRDQGNLDGLAVILVHGGMSSLHTWEPWVKILGEQYRIITLDLPGFGLTGAVPNADSNAYGAAAFNRTISAVPNATGVERFVLGGNSMGGGATWRYALANPERVLAMILVDSAPPGNWLRTERNDDNNDGSKRFRGLL